MPRKRLPFYKSRAWRRLRKACIRRDRFRCVRCRKRFPYGAGLAPHHVTPRPHGADHIDNLVTLCADCHNTVEGEGFRTRFEIQYGVPQDEMVPTVAREFLPAAEVHDWREIDWRIIVYGGATDFWKARAIMAELQSQDAKC